jgi:hypothetical protein
LAIVSLLSFVYLLARAGAVVVGENPDGRAASGDPEQRKARATGPEVARLVEYSE